MNLYLLLIFLTDILIILDLEIMNQEQIDEYLLKELDSYDPNLWEWNENKTEYWIQRNCIF
ncbi:MAG: hypothetical protein ACKPGD_17260 [Planktothrix sp.]